LHFATAARVPRWAALLARARRALRPLHAALNLAAGRAAAYPLMAMNVYDTERLLRIAADAGCATLATHPWHEDSYDGVVLFLRREEAGCSASSR